MQVKTYYPENACLARHIAYFYYIQSNTRSFSTNYYAFPNIYSGLSIYKSAGFQVNFNSLTVHSDFLNHRLTLIQSRYISPLKVSLNGPVDLVNIVFKPLGVNNFISSPYFELTRQVSQVFDEWEGHKYKDRKSVV